MSIFSNISIINIP